MHNISTIIYIKARFGASCASHNGLLYITGGLNSEGMANPNIILIYDVFQDKWLTQASSPSSSSYTTTGSDEGEVSKSKVGIPIRTAVDHVPM